MGGEYFFIPVHDLTRSFGISFPQCFRMRSSKRWEDGNKPLAICLDKLPINARTIIEALEMPLRDKLYQIAVSRLIFCKQDEAARLVIHPMFFVESGARRNVKIDADDGLYRIVFALFVEIDRAVQITVVGQRERTLSIFRRRGNEVGYLWECFEEGIMRMGVKMDEVCARHLYIIAGV